MASSSNKLEDLLLANDLAMGLVLPMTLKAAVELGVFDIIARAGPDAQLSSAEIAAQLSSENPDAPMMLDRMLRFLASHSVLTCSLVGHRSLYGLTPVSKYFIPDKDGFSLAPFMALHTDKVFMDSWYELKDCVIQGGIPFNRVHGVHAFEYPAKDPRFNQVFNAAMVNHTTILIKDMLESYNGFEHLKQVVDVGGGLGVTLSLITAKYPFIKAINYDLPHVITHAPTYPGIEHVGGDMFQSVPKGDAIFMKWILHDWDDEHCLKLLKNCHKATPDDGKVIVMEQIVDPLMESAAATRSVYRLDMVMMTQNPGGKERTREEFMALATTSGFSGINFVCYVCNFWVMEFFK